MDIPERALPLGRGGLNHHIELAGVFDPVQLVTHTVSVAPLRAKFDLCRLPATIISIIKLTDIHR
jgi:hypothetical protein